jgi:hypothetical protein
VSCMNSELFTKGGTLGPNTAAGLQQPDYNSQVYAAYYGQYSQDSQMNGQTNAQYSYQTSGWNGQNSATQSMPIQLVSFSWSQAGRHTAIPLPT